MISMRRLSPGRGEAERARPALGGDVRRRSRRAGCSSPAPTPHGARRYRARILAALTARAMVGSHCADTVARLPPRHSWTHPEGWRDWPYETPATTVTSQREGANSRQMCGGLRALRHTVTRRRQSEGAPTWLSAIFSARSARPSIRSRRCYVCERCFGPLEVAYDHSALQRRRRRAAPPHPGRAAEHLALRRLPAARRRPARALGPARLARRAAGGLHAADPRRPARRAARPARGVGQERRGQPDPLVQGPRRLGRRRAGARARLRDDRLRLDGQPRQLGGRPRRGAGPGRPTCSSRPTWRSRRSSRPASTARTWSRVRRQLRRRQPPVHRALRRARAGRS